MSLLTANNRLVADLWPENLPRLMKDVRFAQELQLRDVVPDNPSALDTWARVIPNPDRMDVTRTHLMVHKHPCPETATGETQIALRLQGFIKRINIKPTGNWTCLEADAHKATQYVVLLGKSSPEVFNLQKDTLKMIVEFLIQKTGITHQDGAMSGDLYLPRRVFNRVRPNSPIKHVARKPADLHQSALHKIMHQWTIDNGLDIGRQEDNGRILRCTHMQIRPGDFVDVTVTADVITSWSPDGSSAKVLFKLQRIIQLKTASAILAEQQQPSVPPRTIATYNRIGFDDDDVSEDQTMQG